MTAKEASDRDARSRLARLLSDHRRAPQFFPLSFPQQRLWFMERLEGTRGYTLNLALRLLGPLDRRALARAVEGLVERQAALRTVFLEADGEPMQAVLPAADFLRSRSVFEVLDLRLEGEGGEGILRAALDRPFDLGRGPLFRALLLMLDDERYELLIHLHHIVADGASMEILARELSELYEAARQGRRSRLEALPASYGEFSRWQRRRMAGEELERLGEAWRRRLAGAPLVLELPSDRPRPARPSGAGGLLPFRLSPELSAAVGERAKRSGCTPFQVWATAFFAFLHRMTEDRDFLVGVPVAGRPRQEVEGLVGFFVNTVVLRGRPRPAATFAESLEQVVADSVEAFDHQDLPFDKLVEILDPPRDSRHAPVVQVSFQLQSTPVPLPGFAGLTAQRLELDPGTSTLDLALYLEGATPGDPAGALAYAQWNGDVFDAATVERWVRHFLTLARGGAEEPSLRLRDLPLLTAQERRQLAEESRTPALSPRPAAGILGQVHRQWQATPEAIALDGREEPWTYDRLWQRSGELAGRLQAAGVGSEVVVGVLLQRPCVQVASLLAVLRSGGVYLPLEPGLPPARLAYLLEDSGASCVVTDTVGRKQLEGLASQGEGRRLRVLDPSESAASSPGGELREPPPEAGSYLIYTSGTTGRPKGVVVGHGALAEHCRAAAQLYGIVAGEGVLHFASIGFDTALEQVLPALTRGARVVLRPSEMWSGAELWQVVKEKEVAVANLSTAYWQQVSREWEEAGVDLAGSPLRLVIAGGEAMAPEAAAAWLRRFPSGSPRLLNAYGPTEATVTATTGRAEAAEELSSRVTVTVGRPLAGRGAWVVDRWLQPSAAGATGQLALGGCLAREYWQRPRATAERFVPDPFSLRPGERLYLTGDLARRRSDGDLAIVGRRDRQLKLRGFRVEPEEIEAALLAVPPVMQAAVVVRPAAASADSGSADWRLLAYVAASVGEEGSEAAVLEERILESLGRQLPAFMLPSRVLVLPALPLNANGKVDRRALPEPSLGQGAAGRPFEAPSGPTEELVAEIWQELLGAEQVGRRDDFFSLGGHSLLATQTVSRLREVLGVELPLRTLFENPTVAALAGEIAALEAARSGPDLPALEAVVRDGPLPLSFAQQRLWFIE
ncbi:MAG: amino acid adenylation domain-containing protein, partial [Acidobacteria bacterium]|nr:amino acid adenylation domain-containing protein [Acidobacteriota bacterium]